jgi:acid stress-induced BolA-like protein IbaG/YrbA
MDNIIAVLKEKIEDAEVEYQGEGSHVMLSVLSNQFKSMSRVQRQRFVKQILAPYFESGQLHAVSLQVGVKDECE